MIYPSDFESKIGFDSLRTNLSQKCTSRLGRDEVNAMKFDTDYNSILHNLKTVVEMAAIFSASLPFPTLISHDVLPYLSEIKAANSYMSSARMFKLMCVLSSFTEIQKFFSQQRDEDTGKSIYPELADEISSMREFPTLVSEISRCINKFGEVKDNASSELYEIRESIRRAQGSMQRAMQRVLSSAVASGIVEKDTAPSLRDGRMVIPVAAGAKRSIAGIVHDESASGKTVFIEPAEVVEAGNRLRQLELDEKRAVIQILVALADSVRPYIKDIAESCLVLGRIDFIQAKAKLAIELGAQMPHIKDCRQMEWYHAVHPALFLSLKESGREVVPLNIHLDDDKRILIISGPNAGGKSVCLKTVACVQYMTQCGLLPTLYYNSHLGVFKNILIDIGDEQSFENDLSTYSSHLKNMRFFLQHSNKRTLFLADEMGSGTEPMIGGALAQAILDDLGKKMCFGVVTTHYQNLKSFAESTPGFVNGAMLYDRQHLQPLFQLSIGSPGSSFALDIAHKMGLPNDVIQEAKSIVGADYVSSDKYLSDIARDRKYWANKRQNIREKEAKLDSLLSKYEEVAGDLKSKRREILDDARREAKEILAEANSRIERTILEIRKVQAEKERTKEVRRDLSNYIEDVKNADTDNASSSSPIKELKHKSKKLKKEKAAAPKTVVTPKKEVAVGDYVKLKDGSSVGEVISISGKKCVVAYGALRAIAEISKLEHAKKPKENPISTSQTISASTMEDSRRRQLNFKNEIDVRGMRADEAIQAVTYFLDDALQFNAGKVRILHGTGHGILKTLIRQQLKANPAVEKFEDEDIRFGGAGITVVYL